MGRRLLTIARLALSGADDDRAVQRYAAPVGHWDRRAHPAIVLAIAGYALMALPGRRSRQPTSSPV